MNTISDWENFEITTTIYSTSENSEQFLEQNTLLRKVSIGYNTYIRIIKIPIGTDNWAVCRSLQEQVK